MISAYNGTKRIVVLRSKTIGGGPINIAICARADLRARVPLRKARQTNMHLIWQRRLMRDVRLPRQPHQNFEKQTFIVTQICIIKSQKSLVWKRPNFITIYIFTALPQVWPATPNLPKLNYEIVNAWNSAQIGPIQFRLPGLPVILTICVVIF